MNHADGRCASDGSGAQADLRLWIIGDGAKTEAMKQVADVARRVEPFQHGLAMRNARFLIALTISVFRQWP